MQCMFMEVYKTVLDNKISVMFWCISHSSTEMERKYWGGSRTAVCALSGYSKTHQKWTHMAYYCIAFLMKVNTI